MEERAAYVKVDSSRADAMTRGMNDTRLPAANCTTMAEVRAGVDSIDRELALLIGERFRFMDAAARIKPERGAVRDEKRKAEVIANARANAVTHGFPEKAAASLWEVLVEASIAYEFDRFDAIHAEYP